MVVGIKEKGKRKDFLCASSYTPNSLGNMDKYTPARVPLEKFDVAPPPPKVYIKQSDVLDPKWGYAIS